MSVQLQDDFSYRGAPSGPMARLLASIDAGDFFYATTATLVRVTAGVVVLGALHFIYRLIDLDVDGEFLIGGGLAAVGLAYCWVRILLLRASKIAGLANNGLQRPATPAVVWLVKMTAELVGVTNVVVGAIAALLLLFADVDLLRALPDVGLFGGASLSSGLFEGPFAGAVALVVGSSVYGFFAIAMGHFIAEAIGAVVALAERDSQAW